MPFSERRKHPRVWEAVPCRVKTGVGAFAAVTENLSCGGAMCRLSERLPAMTKLEISIDLPRLKEKGNPAVWKIRCAGIVIRQVKLPEDPGGGRYETAIYFSEIQPEQRRKIAEFVLWSMLQT